MKSNLLAAVGAFLFVSNLSAGVFAIAGFTFDERNAVTYGAVIQGRALQVHSSTRFGMYNPEYISDSNIRTNHFSEFNRSQSAGRLLNAYHGSGHRDFARAISLPARPGAERSVLQFGWNEGQTLRNSAGNDFVIFESGTWEGFAVAVRKEGSKTFSHYRYQFQTSRDELHLVNAVAFDLSDFGLTDGEKITAIRISNLMNSSGPTGADKVDDSSGQGNVITASNPTYHKAFLLRENPGGPEFPSDRLDADILYVTALHNIEPTRSSSPAPSKTPRTPGMVIMDAAGADSHASKK